VHVVIDGAALREHNLVLSEGQQLGFLDNLVQLVRRESVEELVFSEHIHRNYYKSALSLNRVASTLHTFNKIYCDN
jgi:hypothetical protein